jgi:hypothetical protein
VSDHDTAPIDLEGLHFEPLADRPSKVYLGDLGRPREPGASWRASSMACRTVLAGRGLKRLRDAIVRARVDGRPVVAALGGTSSRRGVRLT